MCDLTAAAGAVTCANDLSDKFDPKAWLAAFKDAGGFWCVIADAVHLRYPDPTPPELRDMRARLTEAEAESMRAAILADYPAVEA